MLDEIMDSTFTKILCKLFQVCLCTLALGTNADGVIFKTIGIGQALVQMGSCALIVASDQQSDTIGTSSIVLSVDLCLYYWDSEREREGEKDDHQ